MTVGPEFSVKQRRRTLTDLPCQYVLECVQHGVVLHFKRELLRRLAGDAQQLVAVDFMAHANRKHRHALQTYKSWRAVSRQMTKSDATIKYKLVTC